MSDENLAQKSLAYLPEDIVVCQEAVKRPPNCAVNYLKLAKFLGNQGKFLAAIRGSQQAVAIALYFSEAYLYLGQLFQQTKDFEQAIAAYLEVLGIQPDYLTAYAQLAQILRHMGRLQDAQLCDRYKLSVDLVHEFYPNPRPWTIFSEANHCPAEITASQIYPPIKIQLYPPKSVENQVDKCFKITSFAYLPAEVAIVHRHRFANAQNGRAWADYYTVAFLTSRNQLIFAYSCGSSPIIAASQKLPPPLQIPGTVAFLSVRWGSTYFHS